jgi:hypothetical protein
MTVSFGHPQVCRCSHASPGPVSAPAQHRAHIMRLIALLFLYSVNISTLCAFAALPLLSLCIWRCVIRGFLPIHLLIPFFLRHHHLSLRGSRVYTSEVRLAQHCPSSVSNCAGHAAFTTQLDVRLALRRHTGTLYCQMVY